jgi:hypothetical protein
VISRLKAQNEFLKAQNEFLKVQNECLNSKPSVCDVSCNMKKLCFSFVKSIGFCTIMQVVSNEGYEDEHDHMFECENHVSCTRRKILVSN